MIRKLLLLEIILLLSNSVSYSQEILAGTRKFIYSDSTDKIYFRIYNSTKKNLFENTYSVFTRSRQNRIDSIYKVKLSFNTADDSIGVYQIDLQSNKSVYRQIKFEPLSSLIKKSNAKPIYSVKDYHFNDTTLNITEDNDARILFTIYDTVKPVIYLHELASIDSVTKFNLDKFRKSHLVPHLAHARDYWNYYYVSLKKHLADSLAMIRKKELTTLLLQKVSEEKRNIRHEKDSLFKVLEIKKQELLLKDVVAKPESQALFQKTMDKYFIDFYFTDTINKKILSSYEVLSSPGHKIDILKKPVSIYDNLNDIRFMVFFLNRIDTAINRLWLENEKLPLYSDDPYSTILNGHLKRTRSLSTQLAEQKIDYDLEFETTLDDIKNECLEKFDKKFLEVPTRYSCRLNYSSETKWEKWKQVKKKLYDKSDSLVDRNSNNYQFFYKRYPKAKNGKYQVKMSRALINDYPLGPDAVAVKRKYKYTTRIGINGGMLNPFNIISSSPNSYNNPYYEFFVTIHHIGFFGGYGYQPLNQNETNTHQPDSFFEGGLYLAPGNVFYFKLGFANCTYNETTYKKTEFQPTAGISFIFPGFQVEAGYNFTFKVPYLMAGLNIPLNL